MINMKKFYLCLILLLFVFISTTLSQYKIPIGIISNGGGNQSNSEYNIWGMINPINYTNSSNSEYQIQSGFWNSTETKINYPATVDLNTTYTFNDITKTNSYQLIGIPGENNLPIADVITGSPGKEGDWRAFWDAGSGDYKEYDGSSTFIFKPGIAFWLISKNPISFKDTVKSVLLSSDNTYSILLHSEWNLISNPFDKIISWSSVQNVNSGLVLQPLNYFQSGSYTNPTSFETYKGYYFYNNNSLTTLKIPYVTGSSASFQKPIQQTSNLMELSLTLKGEQKSKIKIGFSEKANYGLDGMDIFSPPSQFCDVNLSLYNSALQTNYKYLQEEYRQQIDEGQEYNLEIKNTSGEMVDLNNEGLEQFSNYEVYLLNKSIMKFYNLKEKNNIEIKSSNETKEYVLFIGDEKYISDKKKSLLPTEYILYQNYPNPFNPTTKIMFALPQPGNISIKIYNMLGERVADLIKEQFYKEGYHEVVFNGRTLSSGVYIYRLTADKYSCSKKMMILK